MCTLFPLQRWVIYIRPRGAKQDFEEEEEVDSDSPNSREYPTASTCSRSLNIPAYQTEEEMLSHFLWVLDLGTKGFGFV